jgi:hypothetical protein
MATKTRSRKTSPLTNGSAPTSPLVNPIIKVVPRGLDLTFDFHRGDGYVKVQVVICSATAWAEDPQRGAGTRSWSEVLIGDGWIAACRLLPWHREDFGHDDLDPEYNAILRRFRDGLVQWIDGQDWIGRTSVDWGANGRVEFNAEVLSGDPVAEPMVTIMIDKSQMC